MKLPIAGLAGVLCLLAAAAGAAEHEIKVLNEGQTGKFVFEPALLRVAVGDTVTFKAVDRNHTVGTIRGMIPQGAEPFRSERSKDLTVTFSVPGVYGYECFVHIHTFGMSGVIVAGDDLSNLDSAKAAAALTPPREREKLEALLNQVGE